MRQTSSAACAPGTEAATYRRSSSIWPTGLSLKPTMMSPKRNPASAAGLPAAASRTSAPEALVRPSDRASGRSSASVLTPSHALLASGTWLPTFTDTERRRPCGWARWDGTGRGCGFTNGGCGPGLGSDAGGMRMMSTPMSANCNRAPALAAAAGRLRVAKDGTAWIQPVFIAMAITTPQASEPTACRRMLLRLPIPQATDGIALRPVSKWSPQLNDLKKVMVFPGKQRHGAH